MPNGYSMDALRNARAQNAREKDAIHATAEAPHATNEALACWDGTRFISWNEWVLSRLIVEDSNAGHTESTQKDICKQNSREFCEQSNLFSKLSKPTKK